MRENVAFVKPMLADVVDEYGELARRIRLYAPDLERAEELRKQIGAFYLHQDPAEEFVVEGKVYMLRIGKRAINRVITVAGMKKIFNTLGKTEFLAACTFPKNKLEELKLEGIVSEERTGPRKIEAIALEPVAVEK